MYELVCSFEDVLLNINTFNKELSGNVALNKKLSSFQHWYFIKELNAFGPSKFIGYKGNSGEMYSKGTHRNEGCMDGRNTVKLLGKWFKKANKIEQQQLLLKLAELLSFYNKIPNKRVHLHVEIDDNYTGEI